MSDKERERILKLAFFGLLGFVVVWLYVWPAATSFLFGTINERVAEVETLEQDVAKAEARQRNAMYDERRMMLWKGLSLPPDPVDAQREYQKWLTDLAIEVGFESPEVKPGQRIPHRGVYSTVGVEITGAATYDTLVRFLFHVQRSNLMQRIGRLDMVATGTSPSDPLNVTISAEGFSLAEATPRSTLLPRTTLADSLRGNDKSLSVSDATGFPTKAPFEVRLGGEFARVTAVNGNEWMLERGLHRSRVGPHDDGDPVELVRTSDKWKDVTLDDFEEFVAANPFAKPRVYTPFVSEFRDAMLTYGESATFKLSAGGHDPAKGEPTFEFVHGKDIGMTFDEKSRTVTWRPADDAVAGEYDGMVRVTFPGIEKPFERWFTVTLRKVNQPPVVAAVDAMTVTQGESLAFTATATDPEGTAIKYSLRDGPRDATIDPATGEFAWQVSADYEPGAIEFDVVAEDEGNVSTRRAVTVTIRENSARNTFLVGIYNIDGEREAWLYDPTEENSIKLREGTAAQLAGVDSFVLVIGRDFVLLQQDDTTYRLDSGRTLDQLEPQEEDDAS